MGTPINTIDPRSLRQAWVRAVTSVVPAEPQVLEPILCSLLGRTHLLIEGTTNSYRTLLVRALARCIDCNFQTVSCNGATAPNDIVGTTVWRPGPPNPTFVPGPIFANLILLENLDRASESALKSIDNALAANQIVVEGQSMDLSTPFHAIATKNPFEASPVGPLLRSALRHFAVCARINQPEAKDKAPTQPAHDPEAMLSELQPLLTTDQLLHAQSCVRNIEVGEEAAEHVLKTVRATREHDEVATGVSTKATLSWLQIAKARAWLESRDYVSVADLKALAIPSLAHRVVPHTDHLGTEFVDELLTTLIAS